MPLIARKDYEDRRRRQAQGLEKAKADGVCGSSRGRQAKRSSHVNAPLRAELEHDRPGNWLFPFDPLKAG